MKKIWKFEIDELGRTQIYNMPAGARILSYRSQSAKFCLWALVAPEAAEESRIFVVYYTGDKIELYEGEELQFIGTVMRSAQVYHCFEIIKTTRDNAT